MFHVVRVNEQPGSAEYVFGTYSTFAEAEEDMRDFLDASDMAVAIFASGDIYCGDELAYRIIPV